jgi:NADH:ubiquinone oxidoreductase subunit 3 (subunit A)
MTAALLLSPPIVFLIVLLIAIGLSNISSKLAFKPKKVAEGTGKPYACGEDIPTHMIQPNYSQFFSFAFYFTILHVVALMLVLVPAVKLETLVMAVTYILVAVIGLMVLYRS